MARSVMPWRRLTRPVSAESIESVRFVAGLG